jgi:hypothetical protein
MKASEIVICNNSYIHTLNEFTNAIRTKLRLNQTNEKNEKIWEEAASKSENKVVKCLYNEYIEQERLYERFLEIEFIENFDANGQVEVNDNMSIILSEDDKFFLIKAIESGGISDIKSLYDWSNRRMKNLED